MKNGINNHKSSRSQSLVRTHGEPSGLAKVASVVLDSGINLILIATGAVLIRAAVGMVVAMFTGDDVVAEAEVEA